MATRFSDDLFNNIDGSDFIVRKRVPLALQILLVFAIAFVAIYITAAIMRDTGSKTLFCITLTLTIGSLSWLTVFFSASLRDLVLSTEFQNAMLASAARLSTRFCLITKRDGSIVYIDPGFQKLFPHFMQSNDRNIEGLLGGAGIARDVIQNVFVMLQQGENDRVLLNFRDEAGQAQNIMMSIEVLPRPKGYYLLRGRDYVQKRATDEGASSNPAVGNAPLANALNLLPEGLVVADGNGSLIYVNRTLEDWLGFDAGEIFSRPFKLGHIFYQYAGKEAGRPINEDFDGEITLQRKDRSLISLHIHQASLGKTAGICAILRQSAAAKKT